MADGKTYIIACRAGRIKNECPIVLQKEIICVECPYAVYIERVHNTEQVNNNEQVNTNGED